MSVLVLTLPAGSDAKAASWALIGPHGVEAEGEVAPGAAPALPEGASPGHAVALMPAEAVFLRRLSVPGRSERDARRAAPFLIEEQLGQPLEAVSVDISDKGEDGARYLMAVDTALRELWRRFAAGLGVKPVLAAPDAMVIPGHGADLAVHTVGERILVQAQGGDLNAPPAGEDGERDVELAASHTLIAGFEHDLADAILPALAARLNPRRMIVTEGFDPARAAPNDTPIALKRMPEPDPRVCAAGLAVEAFAVLPAVLGAGLSSSFDWGEVLRPWRTAVVLALSAIMAAAGLNAVQALLLERRTEAYEQARLETFTAAFPDTRPVNIDVQLRRRLAAAGAAPSDGGFLQLASALSAIVSEVDGVRVDSVRYDAERGGLSVSALYADFGDFEALRAAAEARDLILEDGGARQSSEGVEGEFTVRLP